jgi:methionine synthase II (cobalamin-independent)
MELDVDAIGVDFYATDASSLPRPFPKTLLAGVIDARNSLLEEAEAVADFGRSLLDDMDQGTQLHLVPSGDLQFVPERIAREKVLRLGAAARILKDAATEEGAVT